MEEFYILDLIGPDRYRSESEIFRKPIHIVYHSKALSDLRVNVTKDQSSADQGSVDLADF